MAAPGAAAEVQVEVEVRGGALERGTGGGGGRRKPQGWKCMPFILAIATFENVGSLGVVANLTIYLVKRFNFGQLTATNTTSIFFGTLNFAPLLGAFISDAYLGRFRTLAYGSFFSLLGMLGLTLSASVPAFKLADCNQTIQLGEHCNSPSTLQLSVLYLSLAFLIIGGGAIRPCSLPFGVDQFDMTDKNSQKGLNSYYNWYYGTTTIGLVFSMTILVYIQATISWPIGFGIPAFFMLLSIIILFMGTRLYVHVPPEGSIFTGIAQVLLASFKKRRVKLPNSDNISQQELLLFNPPTRGHRIFRLPLTSQFRFLNKGAVLRDGDINDDGSARNSWELCSIQQIEEAFNAVGQFEFYNKQFPEQMLTLAGSLFYVTLAGAGYLSTAMTNITKKVTTRDGHNSWIADDINLGKLDYYFYLIALMGVLNLFYFLICSHYYQYKSISHYAEEPIKIQTKEEVEAEMDPSRDAPSK
ncbi:protein NRT1/ PTR FAMILY 2.12-like [Triticum aestivum]|uniref:protein NRT1/ PTR FAMILY 2.12-like n=1 Tax=Triticum aestivum TaxID=4565 RepID=UPI001D0112A4|nr:protein NRT1/ PTR FAMILY 2.12-like [Triticum aestivum]